jgi:hypothetical protein
MKRTSLIALVVVAALLLATVTGIATFALGQPRTATLTLTSGPPELAESPAAESGKTGHTLYFEAQLFQEDGQEVGTLFGSTELIEVTLDGVEDMTRYRTLVFQLPEGQIIVSGVSEYLAGKELSYGALQKAEGESLPELAILGGTNEYAGVSGVLTSQEQDDRTYIHTLELIQ